MTRIGILAALALLAGCTGPLPEARPDHVRLTGTTLAVVFTDGITCRADITVPAGELTDCPHPLAYDVVIHRQSHLDGVLAGLVSPYATVTLSNAAGRLWRYRTPETVNWWANED